MIRDGKMKLLDTMKENNQDFEWYPTTEEILKTVYSDLKTKYKCHNIESLLDIGAGNGKVFKCLDKYYKKEKEIEDKWYEQVFFSKKYAIEKSPILCEQLSSDIIIIGTDFHEQTLIDKNIDVIFCNPPYSEYKEWTIKILKQSNAEHVYMVIPSRWKDQEDIAYFIKERRIESKVLDSFSFENSEDRKARANVDVVYFEIPQNYNSISSFSIWFEETFKIDADTQSLSDYEQSQLSRQEIKNQIISKENLIYLLEKLYLEDMEKLLKNYKSIESLDFTILKELGVDISSLKSGLELKIKGLKNLYWKELFDNLDTITKRLCSKSRNELLSKLNENTNIDFTANNAYAIILWVIKNTNDYIDKQMLEVYYDLSDKDNVIKYKSNKKLVEDGWRYSKREQSHYALDYRIINQCFRGIFEGGYGEYQYPKNLHESSHTKINDIFTVASNFGYSIKENSLNREWISGRIQQFYLSDGRLFVEIKAFKNGNLHFRFMPEFMKKLNIAVGKLNGWLKNEKDVCSEIDGISPSEAKEFWNVNWKISKKDAGNLLEKRFN